MWRSVCGVIVLACQGRAGCCGGGGVLGEPVFDGVAAELAAAAGGEQRVGRAGRRVRRARCGARRRCPVVSGVIRCLRPLPWQETCGPGAEVDVADGEPGQLGDAQPGLGGEQEQGVVAPAGPGGPVGGGEQRVELGFGEVGDEGLVVALGRDRQHPGDHRGVLGVAQRGVAEQRVDRGQPGVAGAGAVAAVVFEVVEERRDQRGVEVGEVELARAACRRWPAAKPSSSRQVSR